MSRIPATFAKLKAAQRKALIPYFTAGDPDLESTVPIMHALVEAGADIVELGVAFSDPMADGPVNQRSSERALKHHTSLKQVIEAVARFRKTNKDTPVVLMGYGNPIEAMGYEQFAHSAHQAGVDGVLVVDYPPEESKDLTEELRGRGLDSIFLLSPTTEEQRMDKVGRVASGYIYYVSLKGVTGAANLDVHEVGAKIPRIRSHIKLPVGVGFGIRDAESARSIARGADAVVIASRLIQELEAVPPAQAVERARAFVKPIREAMDA